VTTKCWSWVRPHGLTYRYTEFYNVTAGGLRRRTQPIALNFWLTIAGLKATLSSKHTRTTPKENPEHAASANTFRQTWVGLLAEKWMRRRNSALWTRHGPTALAPLQHPADIHYCKQNTGKCFRPEQHTRIANHNHRFSYRSGAVVIFLTWDRPHMAPLGRTSVTPYRYRY
jgi:hypothetical protein